MATLGLGRGIFESGPVVIKGFPAWLMHRGYHVLAVPTWERKVRVLAGWLPAVLFGRDIVSLQSVQTPGRPSSSVARSLEHMIDPGAQTTSARAGGHRSTSSASSPPQPAASAPTSPWSSAAPHR